MKNNKIVSPPIKNNNDKNLALISVILGAASFTNTIFTGVPAIILGVMALRRKAGNQAQAKLGIVFGVLGCLLLIPIIWLAVHFLRAPFNQQTSVPIKDRERIEKFAEELRAYKHTNGAYPLCESTEVPDSCADWLKFMTSEAASAPYPIEFESDSTAIEDRPAGTLVYAARTACFLSVPSVPSYLDDSAKRHDEDYAALVYFYPKGRACYDVEHP